MNIENLSAERKKELQLQLIKISVATEMLNKSIIDYVDLLKQNQLFQHSIKKDLNIIVQKCRQLLKSQNTMFDEKAEEWAELLIYIDDLFDKEIETKVQVSINGTVV